MDKSVIKALILIFFLFVSLNYGVAEIILPEAKINFFVSSIILDPVEYDYTGSKQYLGILGDKNRLDIFWNVKYQPPIFQDIEVRCWLNCNITTAGEIEKCYGLQNCSYSGSIGLASCGISNPKYNYSTPNLILCRFSHPQYPGFEYTLSNGAYPQRIFYPIRYTVSSVGGIYTVGSLISFPITFFSYSFLKTNYTAFLYLPQHRDEVYVDNSFNTTQILKYGEIGTVYPRLSFLIKREGIVLYINTTSNELPSVNSLKECPKPEIIVGSKAELSLLDNKCVYSFRVVSGSTYYSMSEYDYVFGIILLFLSLTFFYFFLKFR